MKCPHCLHDFVEKPNTHELVKDASDLKWKVTYCLCANSACGKIIVYLQNFRYSGYNWEFNNGVRVWPKGASRNPVSPEVPEEFSTDYVEASTVLADSAKASAALSRRCLQHLLREMGKTTKKELADQIDEVEASLPSYVAAPLHAVRIIGNFAAHPLKSKTSGEVLDVEPGEAEANLDALEELFDFYFVAPARVLERKAKLNVKLQEAGKPPLK